MLFALLLLAMGPDETAARAKAEAIARGQRFSVTTVKSSVQDGDAWYVVVDAKDASGRNPQMHRDAVFRVWVWKDGSTFVDEERTRPNRPRTQKHDPDPRWAKAPPMAKAQPALAPNSKLAPASFPRERVLAVARTLAAERSQLREIAIYRADFDSVKNEWDVELVGRSPTGCVEWSVRFDLNRRWTRDAGMSFSGGRPEANCLRPVLEAGDWGDGEDEGPAMKARYEPATVSVDEVRALVTKWALDRGVTTPALLQVHYMEPDGWAVVATGTLDGLSVHYRIDVSKAGDLAMRCETKTGGTPPPGVVSRKIALRIATEAADARGLSDPKIDAVWRERRCEDREDGWLASATGHDGRVGIELSIEIDGASGWPRRANEKFLVGLAPRAPTLLERVGPKKNEKAKIAKHVFIDDLGFGSHFGHDDSEEPSWAKAPARRHAALPETGPDVPQISERARDAVLFAKRVTGERDGRDVRVISVTEEAEPFAHWKVEVSARIPHGCARIAFGIDASSGKSVTIAAARTFRRTWIERCERWEPPDWSGDHRYRHRDADWLGVKKHAPSSMPAREEAERRVREAAKARGLTDVEIADAEWDLYEEAWELDGHARRADKRCISFYAELGRETTLELDEEDLSEPGVDCQKWDDGDDWSED